MQNDRSIQERQNNVKELLRVIRMLLKRLRVCWERCEEGTASIEHPPLPNLIPIKEMLFIRLNIYLLKVFLKRAILDLGNQIYSDIYFFYN